MNHCLETQREKKYFGWVSLVRKAGYSLNIKRGTRLAA
jgi:hypothetical protein